jgi:hypothetical protein
LHMEASQHSLLAACFTLHSINATLAIVPQRGAELWINNRIIAKVNHRIGTANSCYHGLTYLNPDTRKW